MEIPAAWATDSSSAASPSWSFCFPSSIVSDHETPVLTIDLDIVEDRMRTLRAALPESTVLYAVKANPAPAIVALLAACGAEFDVASPGEIELCLRLGIEADRLSYGNTVKKERDIVYAAERGVRRFTVDSGAELDKVIRCLPAGCVFARVSTDGVGADWPLSGKFGCPPAEAAELLDRAAAAGFEVGLSFHVGSQQRDPAAWDRPLACVAELVSRFRESGREVAAVNLGGGLPSSYVDPAPPISAYGAAIRSALHTRLGGAFVGRTLIEPGRYLVGDAGTITSEVVLVAERTADRGRRWVYLDIGRFNGLAESLGESIRYRIATNRDGGPVGPVVLAGPSCDSADVLYETYEYQLPLALHAGDRVQLHAAGAYTASYSSVGFNGFEPLRCRFVGRASVDHGRRVGRVAADGGRTSGA